MPVTFKTKIVQSLLNDPNIDQKTADELKEFVEKRLDWLEERYGSVAYAVLKGINYMYEE